MSFLQLDCGGRCAQQAGLENVFLQVRYGGFRRLTDWRRKFFSSILSGLAGKSSDVVPVGTYG